MNVNQYSYVVGILKILVNIANSTVNGYKKRNNYSKTQFVVYQQLEDTISKTGVPREIISDYGSNVMKLVPGKIFCRRFKGNLHLKEADGIFE